MDLNEHKAQLSDPKGRISCSAWFDEAVKIMDSEANWSIQKIGEGDIHIKVDHKNVFLHHNVEQAVKLLVKSLKWREYLRRESIRSLPQQVLSEQSENIPESDLLTQNACDYHRCKL